MTNQSYNSPAIQRTLQIVLALSGYEASGLRPKELASKTGCQSAQITAALWNLEQMRFIDRMENGAVRLSPLFIKISNQATLAFQTRQLQLDADKHAYSGLPNRGERE